MDASFAALAVLELISNPDKKNSKVESIKIQLFPSKNLDLSRYLNSKGEPTEEGYRAITNVFTQGLIANIHASHQRGLRDSAEHLRYIISELERGFIQVVSVETEDLFNGKQ